MTRNHLGSIRSDRARRRAGGCLVVYLASCDSVSLTACASTPDADRELLAFLDRGPVTRADVNHHLGSSYTSYEGSRVIAYRIGEKGSGYYVLPLQKNNGWKGVKYDLVLLFDDQGTLQQHRLIAIRASPDAH